MNQARDQDIRPMVAQRSSNWPLYAFGLVMLLVAVGLFSVLEARRHQSSAPAISIPADDELARATPISPLFIPPVADSAPQEQISISEQAAAAPYRVVNVSPPIAEPRPPRSTYDDYPRSVPQNPPAPSMAPDGVFQVSDPGPQDTAAQSDSQIVERNKASRFVNPATTVPQGTIIQGVLETALNSNHQGFARAVVSRDVSSFDGSRILIPRGSKLFGNYRVDLSSGQNRIMIQWHRLIRPDGGIIDVDSPAADPQGRTGVKGKVNSHVLERFGGNILQSALNIGEQVAVQKATGGSTVYLGYPLNSAQAGGKIGQDVRPTISVRQGASVSVFVAIDLDFSDIEQ